MERSAEIAALVAALAKAQCAFAPVERSGSIKMEGRSTRTYATLDDVIAATRPGLTANALAVVQTTPTDGGQLYVETLLAHESGQWITSRLVVRVEEGRGMNSSQAQGSGLTYARKQGYSALVCVAPDEDDDGESAGQSQGRRPSPAQQAPALTAEDGTPLCPLHRKAPIERKLQSGAHFFTCGEKLTDGTFCRWKPPADWRPPANWRPPSDVKPTVTPQPVAAEQTAPAEGMVTPPPASVPQSQQAQQAPVLTADQEFAALKSASQAPTEDIETLRRRVEEGANLLGKLAEITAKKSLDKFTAADCRSTLRWLDLQAAKGGGK